MHQKSMNGILKHRFPGPLPRVSNFIGLDQSLRICISHKFPGDANAAGRGSDFGNLIALSKFNTKK